MYENMDSYKNKHMDIYVNKYANKTCCRWDFRSKNG